MLAEGVETVKINSQDESSSKGDTNEEGPKTTEKPEDKAEDEDETDQNDSFDRHLERIIELKKKKYLSLIHI